MTDVSYSPPKLTAGIKFPATLWDMVNKCKSDAISWGRFGNCIQINKNLLQKEYLASGKMSFSSFIRQLNMYGFHKVKNQIKYVRMPPEVSDNVVMEYQHPLFVKGHPELLPYLRRKVRYAQRCGNQERREMVKEKTEELDKASSYKHPEADKAKRNKQDGMGIPLEADDSSSSQKLTKTNMDEIFQVVSQSLSKEVTAYGGGARISGPVFPSFNLSNPRLIYPPKVVIGNNKIEQGFSNNNSSKIDPACSSAFIMSKGENS